jgi:hypothetical protein
MRTDIRIKGRKRSALVKRKAESEKFDAAGNTAKDTFDNNVIYSRIAQALARGYTDLYYVNMETDELIEYHTDD